MNPEYRLPITIQMVFVLGQSKRNIHRFLLYNLLDDVQPGEHLKPSVLEEKAWGRVRELMVGGGCPYFRHEMTRLQERYPRRFANDKTVVSQL